MKHVPSHEKNPAYYRTDYVDANHKLQKDAILGRSEVGREVEGEHAREFDSTTCENMTSRRANMER